MKEEDKWVHNLRKHLEDYSEPLPPRGWEDLEKALSASRVVPMWRNPRFVAAAAVFVAAVSSLSIWLADFSSETSRQLQQMAVEQPVEKETDREVDWYPEEKVNPQKEMRAQAASPRTAQPVLRQAALVASASEGKQETAWAVQPVGTNQEVTSVEGVVEEQQKDALRKNPAVDSSEAARQEDRRRMARNRAVMDALADNARPAGRWTVGVMTGNTPYSASNTFGGFSGMSASQLSLPATGDALTSTSDVNSAYKQVLFNNRDKQTWTNVNHKMPVTVGASVKWNITAHWAVETGLNYTFLESEFRSGSEASYWTKNQKLHYVGIPLKVHRKVWDNRWVSLYAAAGGMMEKCVSGSEDILLVRSAQEQTPESHSLEVKPLQWSVQAAVGAQINFTKQFGLYVEPGMAYYFDDGSEVETIRKEHPFNFNLQMGLRFSFFRK